MKIVKTNKKNKQKGVHVQKNTIFVHEGPKMEDRTICQSFQERLKLKRK
jgi:hypothetical protein